MASKLRCRFLGHLPRPHAPRPLPTDGTTALVVNRCRRCGHITQWEGMNYV